MSRGLVSASELMLVGFIDGSSCELAYRGLRKSSFFARQDNSSCSMDSLDQ